MVLYCATGNRHKLAEFQEAAGENVQIRGFGPLPCPETGDSFEANAYQKALCYAKALRGERGEEELLFADDSGIVVDALHGAPGVHSARFAGPEADDEQNNALLLERLRGIPEAGRTARFVCVIALVRGNEKLPAFRGETLGRILESPSGGGGFGYDPLFFFPPAGRTFAELDRSEKWRYSHRGQAYREMLNWLRQPHQRR